jgi:adenylylsulfate kinase
MDDRRAFAGGCIVRLTGLSGSGKTTVTGALRERLISRRFVEVLDGDDLRRTLCRDLGYSKADRETNILRLGYVARLLARNGVVTIVAAISPYRAGRDEVRHDACAEGVPFLEVFLDASLEALIARDPKDLYRKALAGEVPHFTGVSDPYERPEAPDLTLRTDCEEATESVERLVAVLRGRGLITDADALMARVLTGT